MVETASEELSRLRAENVDLKQLLTSNDEQLACKDELLAEKDNVIAAKDELLVSRAAELQRCKELLQCRTTTAEPVISAAGSSKRQRLLHRSASPLDNDDILDTVFSYVGGGEYLYVGGVNKRWRRKYMQYCAALSTPDSSADLTTTHRSVLMTESRLRLALSSGLTVTEWDLDKGTRALIICKDSLEPERVMTLLRLHGVPWSVLLCICAAYFNKLALLQWLRSHSCPWQEKSVISAASARGSVAMVQWLVSVTPPLSTKAKQILLNNAACHNDEHAVMQWLRAPGAAWPVSFCFVKATNHGGAARAKTC
jgi:hypothetical protein